MKTIVLGGGVIGTTTAYYLAKLGHEVHLVDRQDGVALKTSFANGGVLHTSEAEPWSRPGMPTNIWKWLGKEDAPMRPGDFVITCAMGDRVFAPEEGLYDEHGRVVSTGARIQEVTFAEEVHGTFKALEETLALADCTLDDVIDCQVWLRDARDFHEFNRIYAGYFMFEFRIEMKVVAYKPR